ncbi:MAG: PEP-CTERM sorting domain-containing protein [Verrucomicrobiota bacterium]
MKKTNWIVFTVTVFAFAITTGVSQAQFVIGDYLNIDYGPVGVATTAPDNSGPSATGQWNAFASGFQGPGSVVKGNGSATDVGLFGATAVAQSLAGAFDPTGGTGDVLGQDYVFLNDDGLIDDTIPVAGLAVGSYQRFTIFSANAATTGFSIGQEWNLTIIGAGNVDGQGLNILVNDGGTFVNASTPGANAGTFSGYTADNVTTLNGINPTVNGGSTEIEFYIYNPTGTAGTSALNGISLQLVPEPSTFALLALGLCSLTVVRRFRK